MSENTYDKRDIIRREACMIADGTFAQLKIAAYRVRDLDTGEFSPLQFHMTYNNMVMAVMEEQAAKLFARFVTSTLEGRNASPGPVEREPSAAH